MRMVVLVILFWGLVGSVPASALSINWADAPEPVPALTMVDRDGRAVELDEFAGRVVVLNFWATWCAPCRAEMPSLAALQEAFAGEELTVLALAIDRASFDELDQFMAEVGAENLLVLQDRSMASARAIDAPGLPGTLVIDQDGQERFRHFGYADWGTAEVIETLRELVEAR